MKNYPSDTANDPANGAQSGSGADEFNLWCALNDRPFALRLSEWPEDQTEWFVEVDRGMPNVAPVWGTGTRNEAIATAIAYAFVAGIEWSEAERLAQAQSLTEEDDETDLPAWVETDVFDGLPQPVETDNQTLQERIAQSQRSGQTAIDQQSALSERFQSDPAISEDRNKTVPNEGQPPVAASFSQLPNVSPTHMQERVEALRKWAFPPLTEFSARQEELPAPTGVDPVVPQLARKSTEVDETPEAAAFWSEARPAPRFEPIEEGDEEELLVDDGGQQSWTASQHPGEDLPASFGQGNGESVEEGGGDLPEYDLPRDVAEKPETLEGHFSARGDDQREVSEKSGDVPNDMPSVDLLKEPEKKTQETDNDENELAEQAAKLETVLKNFRVRGEIMEVRPGPCVTLFELEPVPGTKSSTIINLADDIARSMSAVTCRIALVPGRSVIGIELPNEKREIVYLREILDSEAWRQSRARLPMALGKDIGGEPVVVDLARMPHLLIAGTTGSGKSVGINAMILSLLYHLGPEQCRLIMIDPKMLELSVYDDIPHLLTPVVTDPHKAVAALKWVVREMENRYRSMALLGVRNLDGYNARVIDLNERGEQVTSRVQVGYDRDKREPVFEDRIVQLEPLPFIVVVVDEMADLMLVAGREIETLIQRLAQMARAAGIHLIMATQRPSVDVITGTIKANFPTRISFQVTSKIDSRTILGESGAEQLLGQGDMLFMRAGGRVSRVHGAFVSDQEVESVVAYLRRQGAPDYVYSVTEEDDGDFDASASGSDDTSPFGDEGGEEGDLYSQALAIILREGKVSVSFVQRQLQIGYNRAARLVERMENEGVISPPNHVGKREILASARQYFANRD